MGDLGCVDLANALEGSLWLIRCGSTAILLGNSTKISRKYCCYFEVVDTSVCDGSCGGSHCKVGDHFDTTITGQLLYGQRRAEDIVAPFQFTECPY